MKQQAIVTIVSNNYLHYARTLMQSVARHHPQAQRYCVIVDADPAPGAELAEEFEAIALAQIGLPFGDDFLFQYTILELNTAVKPWAMQHLLERGHEQVIYIDPDICLYQPMHEVETLLEQGAAIVLTPHLLEPMSDERNPSELAIRMSGTYNLGFCAIGNQPASARFLSWWQGKLARNCIVDHLNGIFVDQSWIDLVPGLFEGVAILRHPGYNAAYWNLAQRTIARDGEQWQANGKPLVFFHFSGIDPQQPQALSKHQDRHSLDTVGPAMRALALDYCASVMGNGQERYRSLPYGFAHFADGSHISNAIRSRYRTEAKIRNLVAHRPFDHPEIGRIIDTSGPIRLRRIYHYFLAREPDAAAIENSRHAAANWRGYLRLALGVGASAESRRHPNWQWRLLAWPLWLLVSRVGPAAAPAPPMAMATQLPSFPPAHRSALLGINLVAYIAAELGVGEAARSLARACSAAAISYSVVDVGYQSSNLQRDTQALANASEDRFAIDVVYVNADQTPATLAHLEQQGLESDYKIGFWHWEQPTLPQAHLDAFAGLDEVWVPSRFVYEAVAPVSPVPVMIIPHALSLAPTPDVQRSQFALPQDKVLALMMYDFHSYQARKNPQAAIAAFRLATEGRSDAVLVVKTINGERHPEALAELRAHLADLPGTVMLEQFLTRQQVWDLQSCCDMLVSLHRAEGFGLAPAEMMYLGKPVVATGWSANMDFMTTDNSMPVRYTLAPLKEAVGAYPAGPLWAEADVEHAAACIRALLDDPALRQRLGQQGARDIRGQLAPETVGAQVRARLQTIMRWRLAAQSGINS
jgi:glycosyltransferase involved in cell wall biosynthesis